MQARPTALQGALSSDFSTTALLLLPIAIAIDIGGGELVKLLQLPLWLDTIGTILIGALCGPWIGAIAGLLGHVIWWLLDLNQYAVWFAPSVGIAGLLAGFAGRLGLFQYTPPRWLSTLMGGALFFGLVLSAFMFTNSERNIGGWPSLPVAGEQVAQNELVFWAALALGLATGYFVLRGVGYAGFVGLITGVATAIVGAPIGAWLFLGEASSILGASIFGQNTVSDPLDKMLSFLVVYLIIQLLPRRVLQRFPNTRAGGGR